MDRKERGPEWLLQVLGGTEAIVASAADAARRTHAALEVYPSDTDRADALLHAIREASAKHGANPNLVKYTRMLDEQLGDALARMLRANLNELGQRAAEQLTDDKGRPLAEKVRVMADALALYAHPANWPERMMASRLATDRGEMARRALKLASGWTPSEAEAKAEASELEGVPAETPMRGPRLRYHDVPPLRDWADQVVELSLAETTEVDDLLAGLRTGDGLTLAVRAPADDGHAWHRYRMAWVKQGQHLPPSQGDGWKRVGAMSAGSFVVHVFGEWAHVPS